MNYWAVGRQMACLQVLDSLLRATEWDCLQCTHTNGVCGTFWQGACFSCILNKMFYWHWSLMFPDPVQLVRDWGGSLNLWFRWRNNARAWSCTQWAPQSRTGVDHCHYEFAEWPQHETKPLQVTIPNARKPQRQPWKGSPRTASFGLCGTTGKMGNTVPSAALLPFDPLSWRWFEQGTLCCVLYRQREPGREEVGGVVRMRITYPVLYLGQGKG